MKDHPFRSAGEHGARKETLPYSLPEKAKARANAQAKNNRLRADPHVFSQ